MGGVAIDLSRARPISGGITLDLSKAKPIGASMDASAAAAAANPFATSQPHAAPPDMSQDTEFAPAPKYLSTFGQHAADTVMQPFRHPIDTAASAVKTVAANGVNLIDPTGHLAQASGLPTPMQQIASYKPMATAVGKAALWSSPPAQLYKASGGNVDAITPDAGDLGDTAGNLILGELGAKALKPVAPIMRGAGEVMEFASATPDAMSMAATRGIVPGTPGEVLNRALKPGVQYGPNTADLFDKAIGPIAKQGTPTNVEQFGNLADKAKEAENSWYEGIKSPYANRPLDTTPMVQPQIASIPATNLFETPGIQKVTAGRASAYDMTPRTETVTSPLLDEYGQPIQSTRTVTPKQPSLATVDEIRMDTNSKLRNRYFESPDPHAALSNPETARLKAVNDGSRDLVYKTLADANGIPEDDIRNNQQMYGVLSDVSDVANKRNTVFSRADPVSLAEKVATGHPGGIMSRALDFAGQRLLRGVTDSDALVRSAVDRYNNPAGTPLPPRPDFFSNATSATGRALQQTPSIPNPLYFAPPAYRRKK